MNDFRIAKGFATTLGTNKEQQDSFGFSEVTNPAFVAHAGCMAVVADGMGGLENAAWCSNAAVQTFVASYNLKEPTEDIDAALKRAFKAAHTTVLERAEHLNLINGMGTTLVAAVIYEGVLHCINIGDSRAYLIRDRLAVRITEDHNFAALLSLLVADGEISAHDAQRHPKRNALNRFLGMANGRGLNSVDFPVVDAPQMAVVQGQAVLLCSDGLSGTLTDVEICSQLGKSPQQVCDSLLALVAQKALPKQDNVTVVVLSTNR